MLMLLSSPRMLDQKSNKERLILNPLIHDTTHEFMSRISISGKGRRNMRRAGHILCGVDVARQE